MNDSVHAPKIFTPEYYASMRRLEADAWWNAGMRSIGTRLLRHARLPERGRLLDAGCGSGQSMEWLGSLFPAWTRYGVDVASDGLAAAAHIGETVALGSVTDLPLAESSFDLVISLDVLQHLPLDGGDEAALREFHRVLRPGGVLLIRTNAQSFPRVAEDRQHMYRRYEPRDLSHALAVTGFEILRLSRANSILGLAEIRREYRARSSQSNSYYGLLSRPGRSPLNPVKRGMLAIEGRLIAAGVALPLGRALFALCRSTS
ncbi:MAG: class I SAM-dependent methyltransferase [Gemmatimonadales bacterium]